MTIGICPEKNPFDHVSFSDEESRDVKKEFDVIDNKFDEARTANYSAFNNNIKVTTDDI